MRHATSPLLAALCVTAALGVTTEGAAGAAGSARPSVVYIVGVGGVAPPGAIRVALPGDVPWSRLPPGARVLLTDGPHPGPMTVTAHGTPTLPGVVDRLGTARPVLDDSIDVQASSWVTIRHLRVEGARAAGVVLRRGTHHVTVAGTTITDSAMGISVTDGAGTGIRLKDNVISRSATVGIAVDRVPSALTDRTVIEGNEIAGSGHHGMEIQASGYLVTHNVVHDSGRAIGGTSGIHLYSAGAAQGVGDDNVVTYNTSYDNHDATAFDGNGIQVDQWCDRNVVAFNLVFGNDGAGISLVDGRDDQITSNTSVDDARRTRGGYRASILVTTAGAVTDRTRGNVVRDNLVRQSLPVPALYVDAPTAAHRNRIGPNLLDNTSSAPELQIGNATARTTREADAVSGVRGNLVRHPHFVDEGRPLAGGLAPAAFPGRPGVALPRRVLDLAGRAASRGASYFGAYYSPPA